MKSLLIKFDTQKTKRLFCFSWLTMVAVLFFTTTDSTTFQWVMEKGGITESEFGAYGKLQLMIGVMIGISAPIVIKVLKARKL